MLRLTQPALDENKEIKLHFSDSRAVPYLSGLLHSLLLENRHAFEDIVVLCIGTDRSTGDSLGPLVGTRLMERSKRSDTAIYGCLDEPVHATNLDQFLHLIEKRHRRPYVIAVDACLGKLENVGNVALGKGPLKPGAGVKKDLPPVGHVHVTGVVNVGGFMEFMVLQNTRLSIVVKLANVISDIIDSALARIHKY